MNHQLVRNLVLGGLAVSAWTLQAATPAANPAEWPGFRGQSNGNAPDLPVSDISKAQITKVWTAPTDSGFSSFAVAEKAAYTLVTKDSNETLVAFEVTSGKPLWSKTLAAARYDGGGNSGSRTNQGGDGPRSTPTVSGGKVYVTDNTLVVWCFDAKTGQEIWKHDVLKENHGKNITWENAASPVIDNGIILLAGGGPGEGLMGLNAQTGKEVWKGEADKMTHATPVLAEILGVHQCVFFTQSGLVSVDPQSGKVFWRAAFPYKTSTAASPVVWGDVVYCSAGYGVGAGAFKIAQSGSAFTATPLWRKEGNDLANHWSTPVVKDGYLYGMFSFKKYEVGPVECVDIRTGDVKWSQPGFGPGQVILSGSTVIALSDKGEVVFFGANPEGYKELKRQALVAGKVWSYPVLAYNHLFARSTKEGGCWELK